MDFCSGERGEKLCFGVGINDSCQFFMLMNNFLSSFALIGFCKEKKRHSGGPRGFLFTNTSLLNAAEAGVGGACVCVEFSL